MEYKYDLCVRDGDDPNMELTFIFKTLHEVYSFIDMVEKHSNGSRNYEIISV